VRSQHRTLTLDRIALGAGREGQIRGRVTLNGDSIMLELVGIQPIAAGVSLTFGRRTLTIARIAPITDSINQIPVGVSLETVGIRVIVGRVRPISVGKPVIAGAVALGVVSIQ
jgi:hypothetical protein